jgi:hypothetical protein
LAPRVGDASSATMTLGEAKALTGSALSLNPPINYDDAFTAAANLAGGAGSSDIFGPDTRSWDPQASRVTAIDVTPPGPRRNVARDLQLSADLLVHVHDTVDFCPGNLGNFLQTGVTVPMSKLEAEGRTKDVELKVNYRRVANAAPVTVPAFRFQPGGGTTADVGPGEQGLGAGTGVAVPGDNAGGGTAAAGVDTAPGAATADVAGALAGGDATQAAAAAQQAEQDQQNA